jgi:hypothetical protein
MSQNRENRTPEQFIRDLTREILELRERTRWIPCAERMPTEQDTFEGRVAAIDEQGYAVIALLIPDGSLISQGIPLTHWAALPSNK